MSFSPQRRALFRHLKCQKWSFCTFWLGNVLRATTACTFSTSQLLKKWSDVGVLCTFWLGNVLRATTACNFSSLIWPHGSAPAALASLPFDPPEPRIIGKTVFRGVCTFSRTCIFCFLTLSSLILFLLFFSSLTLPTSAFHLSILSEVWLLNFLPTVPWFQKKPHLSKKTCSFDILLMSLEFLHVLLP